LGDYGTTSARKLSTDVALAQSTATVVILMGMSKLDQIVFVQKESKGECLLPLFKTEQQQRK
jgi:uroporphyrin-III C-methyltransferase